MKRTGFVPAALVLLLGAGLLAGCGSDETQDSRKGTASEEAAPVGTASQTEWEPAQAIQTEEKVPYLVVGFHEADKATTARIDEFIAAYNAYSEGDLKPLAAFWKRTKDSKLWVWNPYATPHNLSPEILPGPRIERTSPVGLLGEWDSEAPVLVAFNIRFLEGNFVETWIQEWSPDGERVLTVWVPGP